MIDFRCWYCDRHYRVAEGRIGNRFACSCGRDLRVPKKSGGKCRVKTLADWVVEALVYGGGGAFLGLGLGLMMLKYLFPFDDWIVTSVVLGSSTTMGFLAGLFGGEQGVNWVGRMIRNDENR